jgi:hypothetical protein
MCVHLRLVETLNMDALSLFPNLESNSGGKEIRNSEGREGTRRVPNEILPVRHHGADEKKLSPLSSRDSERSLIALDVQEGLSEILPSPHGRVVYMSRIGIGQ